MWKKYSRARQATDDKIKQHMCSACWITLICVVLFICVMLVHLCYAGHCVMLSSLCCSVVIMLYCYCVALLLFVLSYVLIVCTVPLPPGVNPVAVDKYI